MIFEHAVLEVTPGMEDEFEEAFKKAKPLIKASPGFGSIMLERCIETPNRYLLLVEWDTVEDHVKGFRESPAYDRWKDLLHHFYDPFPVVEHYGK